MELENEQKLTTGWIKATLSAKDGKSEESHHANGQFPSSCGTMDMTKMTIDGMEVSVCRFASKERHVHCSHTSRGLFECAHVDGCQTDTKSTAMR